MKSILWIFLVIPSLLSATAVTLKKWIRPNGTRIVVIGDIHIQNEKEALQRAALLSHLTLQENVHLCVEDFGGLIDLPYDDFLTGLSSNAFHAGISSSSLEFRCLDETDEKLADDKRCVMNHLLDVDNTIPFQDELEEIRRQVSNATNPRELKRLAAIQAANFIFLSRILDAELEEKNIYVCVGDGHADFFARAFTELNYTENFSCGGYDYMNLRTHPQKIEKYALDLRLALNQSSGTRKRKR